MNLNWTRLAKYPGMIVYLLFRRSNQMSFLSMAWVAKTISRLGFYKRTNVEKLELHSGFFSSHEWVSTFGIRRAPIIVNDWDMTFSSIN